MNDLTHDSTDDSSRKPAAPWRWGLRHSQRRRGGRTDAKWTPRNGSSGFRFWRKAGPHLWTRRRGFGRASSNSSPCMSPLIWIIAVGMPSPTLPDARFRVIRSGTIA
jgi:hypothetical protein